MARSFAELERFAIDYFRGGAKPREETRIGIELEHLCSSSSDGRRLSYEGGETSVVLVLKDLCEALGGRPLYADGKLIGIEAPSGDVSLEPGCQIEWSSPPTSALSDLVDRMGAWLQVLNRTLASHRAKISPTGFDASTDIDNVPWVPKQRYGIMREHYRAERQVSYAAMALTAGIHVNIDYCNELDWRQKFRSMLLATPVVIALFANSGLSGARTEFRAARPVAWLAIDPPRCQPPKVAFEPDFSYQDWARWVLQMPTLLTSAEGELREADGAPFVEAIALRELTAEQMLAEWELHLSSVFTPVRCNGRLEVRSVDMQQPEFLAAVPAFWYGLVYASQSLDSALRRLSNIRDRTHWLELYERACYDGLQDSELHSIACDLLSLAMSGLQQLGEQRALPHLARLADRVGLVSQKLG